MVELRNDRVQKVYFLFSLRNFAAFMSSHCTVIYVVYGTLHSCAFLVFRRLAFMELSLLNGSSRLDLLPKLVEKFLHFC